MNERSVQGSQRAEELLSYGRFVGGLMARARMGTLWDECCESGLVCCHRGLSSDSHRRALGLACCLLSYSFQ